MCGIDLILFTPSCLYLCPGLSSEQGPQAASEGLLEMHSTSRPRADKLSGVLLCLVMLGTCHGTDMSRWHPDAARTRADTLCMSWQA